VASTADTVQTAPASLGERVRAARRELGLSQAQLAGEELTKGFISQIESGLVRPSVRSLQIIATRLGRPLDYFVGDEPLAATKRARFHRLAAEAAAERRDWAVVRREASSALATSVPPRERAVLLRLVAVADLAVGDAEAAFDRVGEALRLIDVNVDPAEVARLLQLRGQGYLLHGQLGVAVESLEAARDTLEKHEVADPRLRARVLVALATGYRRLNRAAKALSTYELALALAARTSEIRTAAQGYMGIAVSLYDSGELDGALANYARALDLFARLGDTSFELMVLQSLATVHIEQGNVAGARSMAERCLARADAVGDQNMRAVAETILARVALADGAHEEALKIAHRAEVTLAELGDERQRADALRVIGQAHHTAGAHAASDKAYRKAIAILTEIKDQPDLATVAAEYAKLLRARGETDAAFDMLDLSRGPVPRH
jgi:transcriptional regulator with XRE-family HTH domain/Tfp pilus assembly protein PilF